MKFPQKARMIVALSLLCAAAIGSTLSFLSSWNNFLEGQVTGSLSNGVAMEAVIRGQRKVMIFMTVKNTGTSPQTASFEINRVFPNVPNISSWTAASPNTTGCTITSGTKASCTISLAANELRRIVLSFNATCVSTQTPQVETLEVKDLSTMNNILNLPFTPQRCADTTFGCEDGIDNDGDGKTDYLNDFGCGSPNDNDESNASCVQPSASRTVTDEWQNPQQPYDVTNDGAINANDLTVLTNFFNAQNGSLPLPHRYAANTFPVVYPNVNGDGSIDAADIASMNSVVNCLRAQCEDGSDNDSDGKIDYPDDPGCLTPSDTTETDPAPLESIAGGISTRIHRITYDGMHHADVTVMINNQSTATINNITTVITHDPQWTYLNTQDWCVKTNSTTITCTRSNTPGSGIGASFFFKIACVPGGRTAQFTVQTTNPPGQPLTQEVRIPACPLPACDDGVDNDGDGKIDFKNTYYNSGLPERSEQPDPGCADMKDNSEADPVSSVPVSSAAASSTAFQTAMSCTSPISSPRSLPFTGTQPNNPMQSPPVYSDNASAIVAVRSVAAYPACNGPVVWAQGGNALSTMLPFVGNSGGDFVTYTYCGSAQLPITSNGSKKTLITFRDPVTGAQQLANGSTLRLSAGTSTFSVVGSTVTSYDPNNVPIETFNIQPLTTGGGLSTVHAISFTKGIVKTVEITDHIRNNTTFDNITFSALSCPQCDDDTDNDGDGVTDFPADSGCTAANDNLEAKQCGDGLDNDADGKFDAIGQRILLRTVANLGINISTTIKTPVASGLLEGHIVSFGLGTGSSSGPSVPNCAALAPSLRAQFQNNSGTAVGAEFNATQLADGGVVTPTGATRLVAWFTTTFPDGYCSTNEIKVFRPNDPQCTDRFDNDETGPTSSSSVPPSSPPSSAATTANSLPTQACSGSATILDIDTGDLNGDGVQEFVGSYPASGKVLVQYVSAANQRHNALILDPGIRTQYVAVADVTGDGMDDIIAAATTGTTGMKLLPATGTRGQPIPTFGPAVDIPTPPSSDVLAADFTGDGKVDLAFYSSNNLTLLRGLGDGTFAAPRTLLASTWRFLEKGDFNADGKTDIVTYGSIDASSSGFIVLLGGNETLTQVRSRRNTATVPYIIGMFARDFDRDGAAELYVSQNGGNGEFYKNLGNGTLTLAQEISNAASMAVGFVDFNRDGTDDIVVAGRGNGTPGDVQIFTVTPSAPQPVNVPAQFVFAYQRGFSDVIGGTFDNGGPGLAFAHGWNGYQVPATSPQYPANISMGLPVSHQGVLCSADPVASSAASSRPSSAPSSLSSASSVVGMCNGSYTIGNILQAANNSVPAIAKGPNNELWYFKSGNIASTQYRVIGIVNAAGVERTITLSEAVRITDMELGPDGKMWFTSMPSGLGDIRTFGTIDADGTVTRKYFPGESSANTRSRWEAVEIVRSGQQLWLGAHDLVGPQVNAGSRLLAETTPLSGNSIEKLFHINPSGTMTEMTFTENVAFRTETNNGSIIDMAAGPDALSIWLAIDSGTKAHLVKVLPAGTWQSYALTSPLGSPALASVVHPNIIATGNLDKIWFGKRDTTYADMGYLKTDGSELRFPGSNTATRTGPISGMALSGNNGIMYFVDNNTLGIIDPKNGNILKWTAPTTISGMRDIVNVGPNFDVWVSANGKVGKVVCDTTPPSSSSSTSSSGPTCGNGICEAGERLQCIAGPLACKKNCLPIGDPCTGGVATNEDCRIMNGPPASNAPMTMGKICNFSTNCTATPLPTQCLTFSGGLDVTKSCPPGMPMVLSDTQDCSCGLQTAAQPACSDQIDNDLDGVVDLADAGCTGPMDNDEYEFQCNDGRDNDSDGKIDLNDPGCQNANDDSETNAAAPACSMDYWGNPSTRPTCGGGARFVQVGSRCWCVIASLPPPTPSRFTAQVTPNTACELDCGPAVQCASSSSSSGSSSPAAQCNDTLDNDTDGASDFPGDFSCANATDNDESLPLSVCQDSLDNDADGLIDFPLDPGCRSKQDNSEAVDCQDGLDNDNDGVWDMADPGCASPADDNESDETCAEPAVLLYNLQPIPFPDTGNPSTLTELRAAGYNVTYHTRLSLGRLETNFLKQFSTVWLMDGCGNPQDVLRTDEISALETFFKASKGNLILSPGDVEKHGIAKASECVSRINQVAGHLGFAYAGATAAPQKNCQDVVGTTPLLNGVAQLQRSASYDLAPAQGSLWSNVAPATVISFKDDKPVAAMTEAGPSHGAALLVQSYAPLKSSCNAGQAYRNLFGVLDDARLGCPCTLANQRTERGFYAWVRNLLSSLLPSRFIAQITPASTSCTKTQCNDGLDNDGDGKTDMQDPGCLTPQDDTEQDDITPIGGGICVIVAAGSKNVTPTTMIANCPAGFLPTGGGWKGYGVNDNSNDISRPVDGGWECDRSDGENAKCMAVCCNALAVDTTTVVTTGALKDHLTAQCPAGYTMTGGGFSDTTPGKDEERLGPEQESGWHCFDDGSASEGSTCVAVCARAKGSQEPLNCVTESFLGPHTPPARSRCGPGTVVTGGGFIDNSSGNDDEDANAPTETGWYCAEDYGDSPPADGMCFARCCEMPEPEPATVTAAVTGPPLVQPGATAVYTITLKNVSTVPAVDAFIRNHLPLQGASLVSVPAGCSDKGWQNGMFAVECHHAALAPDASVSFQLSYVVPQTAPCTFIDSVYADAKNAFPSAAESVTTSTPCGSSSVTVTSSSSSSLRPPPSSGTSASNVCAYNGCLSGGTEFCSQGGEVCQSAPLSPCFRCGNPGSGGSSASTQHCTFNGCDRGGSGYCSLRGQGCQASQQSPCFTCGGTLPSSRSSAKSASSSRSIEPACAFNGCDRGGSAFCSAGGELCQSSPQSPCFRCSATLSAASSSSAQQCAFDGCLRGGTSFCRLQGLGCTPSLLSPCFSCGGAASSVSSDEPPSSEGSFCTEDRECLTGLCRGNICTGCTQANDCADGFVCLNNACVDVSTLALSAPEQPASACGNGILDDEEECEDGNIQDGDDCSAECLFEKGRCGDGIVQRALGEQCDGSGQTPEGAVCTPRCTLILRNCGNGIPDPGEECDEGNRNSDGSGATCRRNCSVARCGDGVMDPDERCDDGNRLNGDGCDRACVVESGAVGQTLAQTAESFVQQKLSSPLVRLWPSARNAASGNDSVVGSATTATLPVFVAPAHPPVGETGPATVAIMAAGAAAGIGWVRKKKRR